MTLEQKYVAERKLELMKAGYKYCEISTQDDRLGTTIDVKAERVEKVDVETLRATIGCFFKYSERISIDAIKITDDLYGLGVE